MNYQQNSESHWLGCTGSQELIQELTEGSLTDSEFDNTTLNRNRELLIKELGAFRFTLLMTKITKADIIKYQNDDPVLCRVKKYIQADSWPSHDELKRLFLTNTFKRYYDKKEFLEVTPDGILIMRESSNDNSVNHMRTCLPNSLIEKALTICHVMGPSVHRGAATTIMELRKRFYLPGDTEAIRHYISSCFKCVMGRKSQPVDSKSVPMLHSHIHSAKVAEKFHYLATDLSGRLPASTLGGYRYFAVYIEQATNFITCSLLRTKEASEVGLAFQKDYLSLFSSPRILLNDHGSEYTAKVWRFICKQHNIQLHYTPVANARSSLAESRIGSLKRVMRASLSGATHENWPLVLAQTVQMHNASISPLLKISPYEAVFLQSPRLEIDSLFPLPQREQQKNQFSRFLANSLTHLSIAEQRRLAFSRKAGAYENNSHHMFPLSTKDVGKKVFHFQPKKKLTKALSRGLQSAWSPGWVITAVSSPINCEIRRRSSKSKSEKIRKCVIDKICLQPPLMEIDPEPNCNENEKGKDLYDWQPALAEDEEEEEEEDEEEEKREEGDDEMVENLAEEMEDLSLLGKLEEEGVHLMIPHLGELLEKSGLNPVDLEAQHNKLKSIDQRLIWHRMLPFEEEARTRRGSQNLETDLAEEKNLMTTEAANDPEFNSEENQTSNRCSPDGLMENAIKNNLLRKTVQSSAGAENVVVVYDKSSDTAAPISTTKHGETSGAPPTTTSDTLAESKAVDPTEIAVETTAGSVNSETEMANEESRKVIEDDEDKVDEPNTPENSAGSEGEFYSGQSEDDDNEEASMPGSNPEIEQEAEPESESEIEPDVESETEAEAEGVSEENLLKLLADQMKAPTVRDNKNTEDSKSKTVVDLPKRVTRKANLLRKLTGPRRKEVEPPTEVTDRDQPPLRRSLRWKDRKQPNWDV